MGRKPKEKINKNSEPTKYIAEYHHTCNNPAICKTEIQPNENCKSCKFYKYQKVNVALVPRKTEIDWGY